MPNSNWVTDNCQPVIIPKAHRDQTILSPDADSRIDCSARFLGYEEQRGDQANKRANWGETSEHYGILNGEERTTEWQLKSRNVDHLLCCMFRPHETHFLVGFFLLMVY